MVHFIARARLGLRVSRAATRGELPASSRIAGDPLQRPDRPHVAQILALRRAASAKLARIASMRFFAWPAGSRSAPRAAAAPDLPDSQCASPRRRLKLYGPPRSFNALISPAGGDVRLTKALFKNGAIMSSARRQTARTPSASPARSAAVARRLPSAGRRPPAGPRPRGGSAVRTPAAAVRRQETAADVPLLPLAGVSDGTGGAS